MKKNIKQVAVVIMAIMAIMFCICLTGCGANYNETSETMTHSENEDVDMDAPATFKRVGSVDVSMTEKWVYFVDTQSGVVYAEHCTGVGTNSQTKSMTVVYNTDGTPKIMPEYAKGYENMTAQE